MADRSALLALSVSRTNVPEPSKIIPENTAAIGAGVGVVIVGALIAVAFYKNHQVPAAVIAGIGTLLIAPKVAASVV